MTSSKLVSNTILTGECPKVFGENLFINLAVNNTIITVLES